MKGTPKRLEDAIINAGVETQMNAQQIITVASHIRDFLAQGLGAELLLTEADSAAQEMLIRLCEKWGVNPKGQQ